jgi:sulfur carrier protein
MQLTINGQAHSLQPPLTLAALLDQLGLKPDRVAVEYNRVLLPRALWAATSLADNDRLEIVQFVGGGRSG